MADLLPYAHPLSMLPVIALGVLVLREGIALREARLRGRSRATERHRRLARLFVPLLLLGYGWGLLSMWQLRDEALFESVHALLVSATLALALAAGALGLALERGIALERRAAHALLGAGALLFTLASALAGVALLP